jgi:hypothetical protein
MECTRPKQMQPWELIEHRLRLIEEQIAAIREDMNLQLKPADQRLFNLREAEYYRKRAELDAKYSKARVGIGSTADWNDFWYNSYD